MFWSGGRPCELGRGGTALLTGSICRNGGGFPITPWREKHDVITGRFERGVRLWLQPVTHNFERIHVPTGLQSRSPGLRGNELHRVHPTRSSCANGVADEQFAGRSARPPLPQPLRGRSADATTRGNSFLATPGFETQSLRGKGGWPRQARIVRHEPDGSRQSGSGERCGADLRSVPVPKKNPLASSGGTMAAGCPGGTLSGGCFGPGGDRVNSAAGGRRCLRDQSARTARVLILRHDGNGMT